MRKVLVFQAFCIMLTACANPDDIRAERAEINKYFAQCALYRYTSAQCGDLYRARVPVSDFREPPAVIVEQRR